MQPSFWSKIANKTENMTEVGWFQSGSNITYEPSPYTKEINDLNRYTLHKPYYSLSFDFRFLYPNDTVYVAYTVPYTYSAILTHIRHLKLLVSKKCKFYCVIFLESDFISFESLGQSLGGLDIPILKIRNANED